MKATGVIVLVIGGKSQQRWWAEKSNNLHLVERESQNPSRSNVLSNPKWG